MSIMQTNIFYIQSNEIGNKKYQEKWQSEISLVRKEKEDSWLNAIKTKIASFKGRLNFSSKSATTANIHLVESHLDDWLKNNHIMVDIHTYIQTLFSSQKGFSENTKRKKEN